MHMMKVIEDMYPSILQTISWGVPDSKIREKRKCKVITMSTTIRPSRICPSINIMINLMYICSIWYS